MEEVIESQSCIALNNTSDFLSLPQVPTYLGGLIYATLF